MSHANRTSRSFIACNAATYCIDSERDKLGRKIETVEGVTTTYDYTYDLAGRLDVVFENDVRVRDYDYDSNGNRTHVNGEGHRSCSWRPLRDTFLCTWSVVMKRNMKVHSLVAVVGVIVSAGGVAHSAMRHISLSQHLSATQAFAAKSNGVSPKIEELLEQAHAKSLVLDELEYRHQVNAALRSMLSGSVGDSKQHARCDIILWLCVFGLFSILLIDQNQTPEDIETLRGIASSPSRQGACISRTTELPRRAMRMARNA